MRVEGDIRTDSGGGDRSGEAGANAARALPASAAPPAPPVSLRVFASFTFDGPIVGVVSTEQAVSTRAFGIPSQRVDGTDVLAVQQVSGEAFARARNGDGPSMLIASCPRLDGHFLGDPMLQLADRPFTKGGEDLRKVFSSVLSRKGARAAERLASLRQVTGLFLSVRGTQRDKQSDPLARAHRELKEQHAKELDRIESDAQEEIRAVCTRVLEANSYGDDALR